ncbi:Alpha-glucosidase [Minicystis rosea]|nr:Alpha-glucosidase [Minicystis rosea]
MRRAPLAFSIMALLVGCGGGAPATSTTSGGGASGTGGAVSGSGGAGGFMPLCRGMPLPVGDVPVGQDHRSIDVACGSAGLHVAVVESGVVRLRYRGSTPPSGRASYAVIDQNADVLPAIGSTKDTVLVCTDDVLVEVTRADCRVRATDRDGAVLLEDPEGGGYHEGQGLGRGVTRAAAEGEHFYGFGEKTGPLDKRGRTLTFWNTDAYQSAFGGYPPDADPLYQSIPFFIGLRGATAYGVFLDDTHRLRFDMAATDAQRYTLETAGDEVDQYLFVGPAMRDVIARYTALTGRMALPPRWSLGYHQSRWGYSPDTEVLAVATELRNRRLPADGMWLDIQHMDGFRSFTWDPAAFPDPSGLVVSLSALGMHTVAIVDPGIKVDPQYDVYAEGLAQDFFLKRAGAPYVGEVWPGPATFPDFTSPDVRAWWGELVKRDLDEGVSGLWIDMNEPSNFVSGTDGTVPNDAVCAGDGTPGTMADLHNVYGLNEARATYEGMRAAVPERRPFVLTRAGYAGVQRYAAVWTGDAPSTWPTLRGTLPMLLGMGLSGLPFVGSDVGGYSGGASAELFARWMQVGSFSPFFRGHVTSGVAGQEPWKFGTEVEDISRNVMLDRYRLMPYLYSLFWEATQTGAPVLRPLVHEFQADPGSATVDDEAMLGPYLLLSPVLEQGATTKTVYLPPGRWFEARSGAVHEGPGTFAVSLTQGALPTYVREGAIVPRVDPVAWVDEKPSQNLYLDVYPADTETQLTLYEDDGSSFAYAQGQSAKVTYSLQRLAGGARLEATPREGEYVSPPRALSVRVRRVDHEVSGVKLSGAPLAAFTSEESLRAAGKGYFYDARDLSLLVVIPDQAGFVLTMDYDPSLGDPAPPVLMRFRVTVPPGTPTSAPIHIATSANGWTQQALDWDPGMTSASGLVPVPRGDWVFYKYTRGGWPTVEKWPGCVEATNRYELGAAHPDKEDTVFGWADWCP